MTIHARLRPPAACLTAALAVLGAAFLNRPSAHATPPSGLMAAGAVGQGAYGTIKGRLVWGGDSAPAPKVLAAVGKADKDPQVCAAKVAIMDEKLVVNSQNKGIQYGIAYLVKPNGANAAMLKELLEKNPKALIDQKNCVFVPRTVCLHQDQDLVLKSSDPVNHNVHLTGFANAGFNELVPAAGATTKKLVAEKRALPLVCDIHPWMKANIMVFDHPFFFVTDKDGAFEIKGVPTGAQNLVVWQESVGYVTPNGGRGMPVDVASGAVKDVGEIKLDPSKVK